MRMNVNIIENASCTGCCACYSICAQNAIIMVNDKEGFKYPVVDDKRCVYCGACLAICPTKKLLSITNPLKIADVYSKNSSIRALGSSGGIFPELAYFILTNHGNVYGAFFDPDAYEVRHGSSEIVPIEKIFRSKYVQSDIGVTYKSVKNDLTLDNKNVLFCGTPCQISGLYSFLGYKPANLYTIDFKCHGVSSPGVFKHMLMHYEKQLNLKITDITFREKDNGWKKQIIKLYLENGQVKKIFASKSLYYNLFIMNYTLRKSCYRCQYYKKHMSDITLSDAWDINDNSGVSRVFINSEKGLTLIDSIDDNLKYVAHDISIDNISYKHSYSNTMRHCFFQSYIRANNKINIYKCWGYVSILHRSLLRILTVIKKLLRGKR